MMRLLTAGLIGLALFACGCHGKSRGVETGDGFPAQATGNVDSNSM